MPTWSAGSKNRRHASEVDEAPVSVRMPRAIISRTASAFAAPVVVSTQVAERTETTRPGYGPGMPGAAAAAYLDTTFNAGRSERT
jgi:hypothetical protein